MACATIVERPVAYERKNDTNSRKLFNAADYDYFYRLIVKKKKQGVSTKKNELVGVFRRGGFSSQISFWKKLNEEIKIRYDNHQNIFLLAIIFCNKFFRNLDQIFKKN